MNRAETSKSLQVGLLLPSREVTLWSDDDASVLVRAAIVAEEAGFDSVWVGDSLTARPRPEPLVTLGAVAASTHHVTLGTAILLPLLRHPVTLSHSLATLDRLAGGRFVVGIGPGAEVSGTYAELRAVDRDGKRRVAALMSSLDRCRWIWKGRDEEIRVHPMPTHPQGPPIWLAAQSPRLLRLTGERFDGWLPFSPSCDAYARGLQRVREGAEKAGRDPNSVTPAMYLTMAVDDSEKQARSSLDSYMLAYYGVPAEVMREMQACHAGTAESMMEWLKGYVEAGARHLIVRLAHPSLDDYEGRLREIAAATREIITSLSTDPAAVEEP
jgi:alkanesulfonate monooxygenase SsuD/methylene tetrahydromethanopterin reductase-like flavin-dependent oxidoreductase (luciferase family)